MDKRFNIREIAIDLWNATQLALPLQGDGFDVVTFGQRFKGESSSPKEWKKLVQCSRLRHGGNSVLRWMSSYVPVETGVAGKLKRRK